jgi:predicted Zn-dependent peptidase
MKHSTSEYTLANGIRLLVVDVPKSNQFNMAVAIGAGYRRATIDDPALFERPHVLEHLTFDGSKKYQSGDTLQDIFSSNGGWSNATTTSYHTIFAFHNRTSSMLDIIDAALDMVFFPSLTEKSFEEEMMVIENELAENMGDFDLNANEYTQQQILPDLVISTDTQLARLGNISHKDVVGFHRKYYGTKNTTIIISCDVKQTGIGKIKSAILAATKSAPAGKYYKLPKFSFVKRKEANATYVKIGRSIDDSFLSLQYMLPGSVSRRDTLLLNLLCSIAGGMKSYSVNHKLRKKGLVYGLNIESSQSIDTFGISLSINAGSKRFVDVFAYALGMLRDFVWEGITNDQFEKAKKEFIDSVDDDVATADGIMSWYLSDYLFEDTLISPQEYKQFAQSVTQDEMLTLARKVLKLENQFATVFSAKGVRAATSINLLAKEILENEKTVDQSLIETNSVHMGKKSLFDKVLITITLLFGLLVIVPFIVPGLLQETMVSLILAWFGPFWSVVFAAYFLLGLGMLIFGARREAISMFAYLAVTLPILVVIFSVGDSSLQKYTGAFADFSVMSHIHNYSFVLSGVIIGLMSIGSVLRRWMDRHSQAQKN